MFVTDDKDDLSYLTNIHVSEQITSIFVTTHTCLRQESLSSGNLRTTMEGKSYTIQSGGVSSKAIAYADILKSVSDMAKGFGLVYLKPTRNENNHWYGTAAPIIGFINMFKVRLTELRVGHGSFTIQKDSKTQRMVSSDEYGMKNVHHPLLEGITIPPEKVYEDRADQYNKKIGHKNVNYTLR